MDKFKELINTVNNFSVEDISKNCENEIKKQAQKIFNEGFDLGRHKEKMKFNYKDTDDFNSMYPQFWVRINDSETFIIANATRMEMNTHEVLLFNKKELVAVFPKHSFKSIHMQNLMKQTNAIFGKGF